MDAIKVLVVDDTIVYRKIVSDVLAEIPGVTVAGTANNGKIALSKIKTLQPDLITLDIEMPEMNGLQVLEYIRDNKINTDVVMLSTLTVQGGEMTIRALELGAFDFIPKPQAGTMTENLQAVKDLLTPIVKTLLMKKTTRNRIREKLASGLPRPDATRPAATPKGDAPVSGVVRVTPRTGQAPSGTSEIVAIGISTGGPNALAIMMPMLPEDINVPIVIVQHMPPIFTQSLANSLNAKCSISVKEAANGDILEPNVALIAPGGKQMKITAHFDGKRRIVKITDDPPVNSCKPSADYLFDSVASHYIGRSTGVIMTGMGSDGTAGLKHMKTNGAKIIAQNEETCTVFGMPKDPIEQKIVDVIAPLEKIAEEIVKTVKHRTGV